MFFQIASFCPVVSPSPPHRWALGADNQFSSSKILKQLMRLIGLPSSLGKAGQLLLPALYVKNFHRSFRKRKIKAKIHSWPISYKHLQTQRKGMWDMSGDVTVLFSLLLYILWKGHKNLGDLHNYPWHKGKFLAIVSNGGRGTKADKKSLKCCLAWAVQLVFLSLSLKTAVVPLLRVSV